MIAAVLETAAGARDVPAALLARVRSEFLEMPGLRLTRSQAARLWGLDDPVSNRVLALLVDAGFLYTRDGAYMRRSSR